MIRLLAIFTAATALVLAADKIDSAIEDTWFETVDGKNTRAEYIDLNTKTRDRLFVRYGTGSDSGVEIERVVDGKVIWRKHVQPLGVPHSAYLHEVHAYIDSSQPDAIQITSIGFKVIYESRSISDGRELSRLIKDKTK